MQIAIICCNYGKYKFTMKQINISLVISINVLAVKTRHCHKIVIFLIIYPCSVRNTKRDCSCHAVSIFMVPSAVQYSR